MSTATTEQAAGLLQTGNLDVALCLLRACGWAERAALLQINRAWASEVAPRAWREFCLVLRDRGLYVPEPEPPSTDASSDDGCSEPSSATYWRAIFDRLYPCRHLWHAATPEAHAPSLAAQTTMRVCVRFRPQLPRPAAADGSAVAAAAVRVVLPLHQRLQLIKASHGCTAAEAQRLLWGGAEGGENARDNNPFAAPQGWDQARALAPPPADGQPLAERPPTNRAADPAGPPPACAEPPSTRAGVVALDASRARVVFCAPTIGLREFRYSAAFDGGAAQAGVYGASLRPLVIDLLNGVSGCLLAFGQTGSGKTHTMSGSDEAAATTVAAGVAVIGGVALARQRPLAPSAGLIPRALSELLAARDARRLSGIDCELRLAYAEVYGDDITDLLRANETIGAWRGVAARAFADGRADVVVEDAAHATELLLTAERAKRRAATAMNARSSRAHAVLTLSLVQTDARTLNSVRSTLCLADLGGSEQLKRSKAQGERLREAVQINLGLLALKNCVAALTQGSSYVPYQNSKLTMMLMPGLSGRSHTTVVVCASPAAEDAAETVEALRFGELCAVVESHARLPAASLMAETLRALEAEIGTTEAAIVRLERWETFLVEREDERADASGPDGARATERVLTTKLVGAEAERARLEELLLRRRELLGETA